MLVKACFFGKVCTNPLSRTVCNASSPEMGLRIKKEKTRDNTQAVVLVSDQSSDPEQHDESDREAQEGDTQAREITKRNNTRRGSGTIAHQSFLIPSNVSFFGTRKFVLNSLIFVEHQLRGSKSGQLNKINGLRHHLQAAELSEVNRPVEH